MGGFGKGLFGKLSEGYNTLKANREEAARVKLYTTFQIPETEEILSSHLHTALGAITDGVVATNNALYLHESHRDEDGAACIPYTAVCEYIAVQVGVRDPVYLYGQDGSTREILGRTMVDGKTGPALVERIRNVQAQLLGRLHTFVEQRDKVARRAIEDSRNTVRHNGLSPVLADILVYLCKFEAYRKDALSLVAQDYAQRYTQCDYKQRLEELCGADDAALLQELLGMRGTFVKTFVQDMLNLSFEMDRDRLGTIFDRLSEEENNGFSKFELGVLAVRALRFDAVERCAATLENAGSGALAKKLRFFSCVYRNRIMKKVFEKLRRGEEIEEVYLNISDGFGLTALHYALILGNQTAISTLLLRRREWLAPTSYPALVASGLDYINLAMLLGDEELANRLVKETPTAKKMMRRIQLLHYGVQAGKIALQIAATAATANAANHDYDEERDFLRSELGEDYDEGIDSIFEEEGQVRAQYLETAQNAYAMREQLGNAQSEAERQMWQDYNVYCDTCLETAAATAASWRTTQDPLIAYFVKLYTSPDFLYEILSSGLSAFQLFQHENYYFIVPPDMEEEINDSKRNGVKWDTSIDKPYGSSWFSPAAHSDADTLRKEFRSLAKKYHPDVSQLPNSTVIIQDISNEYSDLMLNFQAK